MAGHVLLVEDEPSVGELVRGYLARDGWTVVWVRSGEEALVELDRHPVRIVLLDVGLPGIDGFAVCTEIRTRSRVPILMLTARDEEPDRVVGLEVGADDYVTKPFSPRELTLRIQAVLRRTAAQQDTPPPFRAGRFEVDIAARRIRQDDCELALTVREFDLLAFFITHSGQAFTRKQLLEQVWGWSFGDLSTVTVCVRRLREKLEENPTSPAHLQTVWGVGYRWETERP